MNRVIIIGALQEEVNAIRERIPSIQLVSRDRFPVYEGKLNGISVVVAQSGVGKANAASTTTELLLRYPAGLVINVGSAGGLKEGMRIGDVVVADQVRYHDLCFDAENPELGQEEYTYGADIIDVQHMESILEQCGLRHHHGMIISGDTFVDSAKKVMELAVRIPQAMACEMEAAAVGQVATRFGVPFLILRAISDLPLTGNNAVQFDEFLPIAAANSARVCEAWIQGMRA